MTTEESITTNVKVSDAEIDNLVGRGIIRVLRYAGNFVYSLSRIAFPSMFYIGTVMCLVSCIAYTMSGDISLYDCISSWLFCTFLGAVWLTLESDNMISRFAKLLKINEV
ncbi:MAG: hypothetical protein M0R51_10025 [Clostridia bacterium]|jgi:hypothetical protein|nr:hypothetical protein [Clostridia bacterium]